MDNEEVVEMVWKPWALPAATGIVTFGLGAGVSYILAKRKFDKQSRILAESVKYIRNESKKNDNSETEELVDGLWSEIAHINRTLTRIMDKLDPQSVVSGEITVPAPAHLLETNDSVQKTVPITTEEVDEIPQPIPPEEAPSGEQRFAKARSRRPVVLGEGTVEQTDDGLVMTSELNEFGERLVRNIFDNDDDDWDFEVELQNRNPDEPYIIHVDEFAVDEMGWDSRSVLTWYEGDEILVDSKEVPIYNPTEVCGNFQNKFGHGSGDPNIVYVRNEKLQAEYEILRDTGRYEDTLLGSLQDTMEQGDLKHYQVPKMRRE